MLVDVHVHLLPPRRLRTLIRWMRNYFPEHPVPEDVTLEPCIVDYEALGADYLFNYHALEAARRPVVFHSVPPLRQ